MDADTIEVECEIECEVDVDEEKDTLLQQIEHLKVNGDLLQHRLDSIERLLDQQTFQLQNVKIRVAPLENANQVRELLKTLELEEDNLVLGDFLKALNRWLIKEDLVDLNDLQIYLSPLVAASFQKPIGLKKIPYALLLTALPKMFV
jgi:hypothetical protein